MSTPRKQIKVSNNQAILPEEEKEQERQPRQEEEDENNIICPICLEYCTDPITLPYCGHIYCRKCLLNVEESKLTLTHCAKCKKRVGVSFNQAKVIKVPTYYRRYYEIVAPKKECSGCQMQMTITDFESIDFKCMCVTSVKCGYCARRIPSRLESRHVAACYSFLTKLCVTKKNLNEEFSQSQRERQRLQQLWEKIGDKILVVENRLEEQKRQLNYIAGELVNFDEVQILRCQQDLETNNQ